MGCGNSLPVPEVDDALPFEEYFPDRTARQEQRASRMALAAVERESRAVASTRSIRELLKRRLLHELIGPCCPDDECLALVLDAHGASVLGAVAKMSDVMFPEGPVAIVQNLERSREPSPLTEAVYFVEPTPQNVERIIADFPADTTVPQMYYGVHILFCSRAPDSIVSKLATCPRLLQHLITVEDANLDTIPLEPRVFHIGMPKAIPQLFGKSADQRQKIETTRVMVDRLVTLCLSLHEYPLIRFRTENPVTRRIAEQFQERMNKHLSEDKSFWYYGMEMDTAMERATLILVDRREDLVAPLMHESTVQAMAFDVLDDSLTSKVFSYVERNKDTGKSETKNFYLNDETNETWMRVRHQIYQDCFESIDAEKAALVKKYDVSSTQDAEDMRAIIAGIDEFNTKIRNLTGITKLLLGLQNEQERLIPISKVEAEIATGVGERDAVMGSTSYTVDAGTMWKNLCALLGDVEVGLKEKMRLIAMYMIKSQGLSMKELNTLKTVCCPPVLNLDDLANFLNLGAKIQRKGQAKARDPADLKMHAELVKARLSQDSYFPVRTVDPMLYHVVKDHIENKLSENDFGFLVPPPPGYFGMTPKHQGRKGRGSMLGNMFGQKDETPSATPSGKGGRSVRRHRLQLHAPGTDDGSAGGGNSSGSMDHGSTGKDGGTLERCEGARVIVFSVGGMTYSEMRGVYKAMKETKREILLGSTHTVTPNAFLNDVLNELGADVMDKTMADLDSVDLVM